MCKKKIECGECSKSDLFLHFSLLARTLAHRGSENVQEFEEFHVGAGVVLVHMHSASVFLSFTNSTVYCFHSMFAQDYLKTGTLNQFRLFCALHRYSSPVQYSQASEFVFTLYHSATISTQSDTLQWSRIEYEMPQMSKLGSCTSFPRSTISSASSRPPPSTELLLLPQSVFLPLILPCGG